MFEGPSHDDHFPGSLVNEEKVSMANEEHLHYGHASADDSAEFFSSFHNLGEVLFSLSGAFIPFHYCHCLRTNFRTN